MDFKPGPLSVAEAARLNELWRLARRANDLQVAAPLSRYDSGGNIVIGFGTLGPTTTSTTTTSTTTPAPCLGKCYWSYNLTDKRWFVTSSTCTAGCNCLPPTFCPPEGSTCATWEGACGRVRATDAPNCTGTTSTTTSTSTTPGPDSPCFDPQSLTTTRAPCGVGNFAVYECHPRNLRWTQLSNACGDCGGSPVAPSGACPGCGTTVVPCVTSTPAPCGPPLCGGGILFQWLDATAAYPAGVWQAVDNPAFLLEPGQAWPTNRGCVAPGQPAPAVCNCSCFADDPPLPADACVEGQTRQQKEARCRPDPLPAGAVCGQYYVAACYFHDPEAGGTTRCPPCRTPATTSTTAAPFACTGSCLFAMSGDEWVLVSSNCLYCDCPPPATTGSPCAVADVPCVPTTSSTPAPTTTTTTSTTTTTVVPTTTSTATPTTTTTTPAPEDVTFCLTSGGVAVGCATCADLLAGLPAGGVGTPVDGGANPPLASLGCPPGIPVTFESGGNYAAYSGYGGLTYTSAVANGPPLGGTDCAARCTTTAAPPTTTTTTTTTTEAPANPWCCFDLSHSDCGDPYQTRCFNVSVDTPTVVTACGGGGFNTWTKRPTLDPGGACLPSGPQCNDACVTTLAPTTTTTTASPSSCPECESACVLTQSAQRCDALNGGANWYVFTNPEAFPVGMQLDAFTAAVSPLDAVVYQGACGLLVELAAGSGNVYFTLDAGETVYVTVTGGGPGDDSCVTVSPGP